MTQEAFDDLTTRCITCNTFAYNSCGHGVMTKDGYLCQGCSGGKPGLPSGLEMIDHGRLVKPNS